MTDLPTKRITRNLKAAVSHAMLAYQVAADSNERKLVSRIDAAMTTMEEIIDELEGDE